MGCGWNPLCYAGEAAEAVKEAVSDVAGAAVDAAEAAARAVVDGIEEAIECIGDVTKAVLSITYNAVSDLAIAVGHALTKFGEVVVGFVKVAGQWVYLLGEALGKGLDYVINAVVEAGKIIAGEIYNFAGELVGFVVDGVLWLFDSVVSVTSAAIEVLQLIGEFAWDAVTLNPDIFNNLWDNFVDVAKGILRVYETIVKGAFQLAGQLYEMTIGRLSGYLADSLKKLPWVGNFLSDAVRFMNDTMSFGLNFLEVLASLPNTLGCVFSNFLNEDAELHNLLPSLVEYPDSEIASGRVKVLPPPSASVKYAILSDMHLFFSSELDYYSENDVSVLHRGVLNYLANSGYHLIENGDIEDLWRRDSGDLDQHGSIGANQIMGLKAQLREVIENNQSLYELIYQKFESLGRYSRTVGNHDLPMIDQRLQEILRWHYPSTTVNEFILIGDGVNPPSHLIAHGHQLDQFNRPGCTWFGESITRLVSRWDMVCDFSEHMSTSSESIDPIFISGEAVPKGRKNVLDPHNMFGFSQLDEPDLFKHYIKLNERMDLPWIILGHSHDPRYMPGYEENDKTIAVWGPKPQASDSFARGGYANTGTTGMWKKIAWFLTIEQIPETGQIATLLHAAHLINNGTQLDIATLKSVPPVGPGNAYYSSQEEYHHMRLARI